MGEVKEYLTDIYNEIYESIKRYVESKYTNVGIQNKAIHYMDFESSNILYSVIELIDKDGGNESYIDGLTIRMVGKIVSNGILVKINMNNEWLGRRTIRNGKYQKLDNIIAKIQSIIDDQILYHINQRKKEKSLRKYLEDLQIYPSKVLIYSRIAKCYVETKDIRIELVFSIHNHEITLENIYIFRRDRHHTPELDIILDSIRTIQMMS